MVRTTIKSFLMALLSHCWKNGANREANRPAQGGILLICAISLGQDVDCGILLVVSGCCRLGSSTTQRLRAKSIAHAHADSFSNTGI